MDYERIKEQIIWDRIKQMYNDMDDAAKSQVERVFPELKESEDEKIRKELIGFLRNIPNSNYTCEEMALWLEKQGNLMGALQEANKKIGELVEENYYLKEQDEQKPVFEMKTPEESLGIDSETYNKIVDECIYGEQKPAWSEEDESWFKELELMALSFSKDDSYRKEFFDWLKSLRPQNRWKPSDLPHWKKSTLPNCNTTGFNSDYFCHKGYCINYKELFEKLPKDD